MCSNDMAPVYKIFGRSIQTYATFSSRKRIFFPTLENGTRVRSERIRTKKLHCGLLGCALTEEQPDAKDKQRSVNETELSPSKLCEKKKEMTVVFKLHQSQVSDQNAH